jgi:hypothetical protein
MRADGDPIPRARSLEAIKADPDFADDLRGALIQRVESRETTPRRAAS